MEERNRVDRAMKRVAGFGIFSPEHRVWLLELRQAVEQYLRRLPGDRHTDLRKAFRLVHDMPELKADEAERWGAFRAEVKAALQEGS